MDQDAPGPSSGAFVAYRQHDEDSSDESDDIDEGERSVVSNARKIESFLPVISAATDMLTPETIVTQSKPAKKPSKKYGKNLTQVQITEMIKLSRWNGWSPSELGNKFGKSPKAVGRILKKALVTGDTTPKPKGRTAPSKIDQEGSLYLRALVKDHSSYTLDQYQEEYRSFQKKCSSVENVSWAKKKFGWQENYLVKWWGNLAVRIL